MIEYCTLAQVKDALDLRGNTSDTWITNDLIPETRSVIDRYVGYDFQSTPATRTFRGSDFEVLFTGKISSLTNVAVEGTEIDCYIWPENVTPGSGIKRQSGEVFDQDTRYTVTGSFGYSLVPPEITRACTRLVVHWFKLRDTNYSDTVSEQGSIRQKYTKELPEDVREILDLFKSAGFYSR